MPLARADRVTVAREFEQLLLNAPALIAVQQDGQLHILPITLHGSGNGAPPLDPRPMPALDPWLRAKSDEVIRSGQAIVGVEEPLQLGASNGASGPGTMYLTYAAGPLRGRAGAPEGSVTFAMDVTAAVSARSQPPHDLPWFQAAIEALPTPVVLAEPDTERIRFANRAARELSQSDLASGSVFGQAVGLRAGFSCTDAAGAPIPSDQLPGARASRGERVEAMELSWHTPVGVVDLLCFAEKVPATASVPPLLVLSFFDVTHMRRVERRVRDLLGARDDFLRLASHELRTPITVLRLHAQSLVKKYPEISGLVAIERATARMEVLAEEMLSCADILEHGVRLHPRDVELDAVVDAVIQRLDEDAKRAGCSVSRSGPCPIRGRWDQERLEQVLVHLIGNAMRFGAGKPVRIACVDLGDRVQLSVADQGIGIDPGDHERIFERFARAATPRHFGGLGLGLWMVREIAQAMGGTIRVDSALGKGATFTVDLPKWT